MCSNYYALKQSFIDKQFFLPLKLQFNDTQVPHTIILLDMKYNMKLIITANKTQMANAGNSHTVMISNARQ